MRVELQINSIDKVSLTTSLESQMVNTENTVNQQTSIQTNEQELPKEKLQQAVDSINDFFEINNRELKFVYHDGLEEYFVQLVNTETEEVIREIPSKKLLDVYYEMQKLVGMIVDEKI
ncbi:flagellar protein FlaG [Lysinibacillus endophyticus]|uniref:flagellar protein FlaG n=1 Tax=Ureibacillus endophyticus TaxID=1978490 RepID=UPI0020A10EB9|nr:flagellar protein FlaG [Lysinibacillus endophyticus]MCP1143752.1 flagellar protein FlaG [Lysinibacillus endophyticus]